MQVHLIEGMVTHVPCSGLLAPTDSKLSWDGAMNSAIKCVAGSQFHALAARHLPLRDGQVIYVPRLYGAQRVPFKSVIFVVDDARHSLTQLVLAGLHEAERQRLATVVMPALWNGWAAGLYRRTVEQALDDTAVALLRFAASGPQHIQHLGVVIPYGLPRQMFATR